MFITPKKENREYYMTLLVVDDNDITKTKEYYPKTYADSVYLGSKLFGKTFSDHMNDNYKDLVHLKNSEIELLRKTPEEGGLVKLDPNGYIYAKHTNPITVALYYDYLDVHELINSSTFVLPRDYGRLVMVRDSFDDPRSRNKHKWTLYRYIGPAANNILSYQVIISEIDIDLVFTWEQFTEGMRATVEEIDNAIKASHKHNNLNVIEKFHLDQEGNLNFDGMPVSIREKFKSFVLGRENETPYLLNGDMGMQITSVRQIDTSEENPVITVDEDHTFDQTITLSGDCSEMFRSRTDLINSPKLNTSLMTKADHFFDSCIHLKSIDWYDFRKVVSANYFAYECQDLKYFPEFELTSLEEAESFLYNSGIESFGDLIAPELKSLNNFFNNCFHLKSINSINAPKAISMNNMFYNCIQLTELPYIIKIPEVQSTELAFFGCTNLRKIGKINSPSVRIMNRMFANCSKLVSIEEIDMSSCDEAENMFTGCNELKYVGIKPGTLKTNISFFNTKLSIDCLRKIIKNLPVVSDKTITISFTDAASKITTEEIANAKVKGWTIQR